MDKEEGETGTLWSIFPYVHRNRTKAGILRSPVGCHNGTGNPGPSCISKAHSKGAVDGLTTRHVPDPA